MGIKITNIPETLPTSTIDLNSLTAKTTPVDADLTLLGDSASSFANKKSTFTNLKAFFKTYFDTLYQTVSTALLKANNLSDLTNVATAKSNLSLVKSDVGLGNVDNTTDLNKPVSTATQTALDLKVTEITGTDNAIVRNDGTGGNIQNSSVTISDAGLVTTNGGFKVNTNTAFVSSDGAKIYKAATLGMVIQGVTGSSTDVCFVTPTGVRLMENPTGTTNLVSGSAGNVNYYLGYSTMTANNPTFYVYGWNGSAAKYGSLKVATDGNFQIYSQGKVAIYNGSISAFIGGKEKEFFADAGNTTTGETDAMSYTTPANRLNVNGECLEGEYCGTFVNHISDTRQIKLKFAGTTVFDSTALPTPTATEWFIKFSIVRKDANTVRCFVVFTNTTGILFTPGKYTEVTGLTLSNTNILKLTLQSSTNTNDIVAKSGIIKWSPAGN